MRVNQQYAEGFLCPRCGRPLIWIGEWHGPRYVRRGREVTLGSKVSESDRPAREEVSRSGLEVKTRTVWVHRVTLECKWCSTWLSEEQAVRGLPEDPPGDWWESDWAPGGAANGVQTGGGPA